MFNPAADIDCHGKRAVKVKARSDLDLKLASYLMGHSDIRVTANIYQEVTKKMLAANTKNITKIFDGSKKVVKHKNASLKIDKTGQQKTANPWGKAVLRVELVDGFEPPTC